MSSHLFESSTLRDRTKGLNTLVDDYILSGMAGCVEKCNSMINQMLCSGVTCQLLCNRHSQGVCSAKF